jgi:hypothetical protein
VPAGSGQRPFRRCHIEGRFVAQGGVDSTLS